MEFPVGRLTIFSFNLSRTTGHKVDLEALDYQEDPNINLAIKKSNF